jgi:hypothetical protein
MDNNLKTAFDKCFNIVKNNTSVVKAQYPSSNFTNREKLWNKLCPAYYVIGPEGSKRFFNEESKQIGIYNLLTHIIPNEKAIVKNIFLNNIEMADLEKWVKQININQAKNLGCHFSHVIAAMDIVKNNYTHAIVFEEDCKFKFEISDSFLENFSKYLNGNIHAIPYLNLGTTHTENVNVENFKVTKRHSPFTQSYVMNLETAKKLVDSVNTKIEKPNSITGLYNKEQFYRGGADDFFMGYIESYVLNPAITYQQFIGTNIERNT